MAALEQGWAVWETDCGLASSAGRAELARYLGIAEWNPVVWIGRLFRLDNDVREHWFDHWHLREERLEGERIARVEEERL